jgi:hypothetical protein
LSPAAISIAGRLVFCFRFGGVVVLGEEVLVYSGGGGG